jgi:carotenoid cleavage dioxygenase-like enzyme
LKQSLSSQLTQFEIDPKNGKLLSTETLTDDLCEFPIVNEADVGSNWDTTYYAFGSRNDDLKIGLARYSKTNSLKTLLPEGTYVSEPLFIQNPEKQKD